MFAPQEIFLQLPETYSADDYREFMLSASDQFSCDGTNLAVVSEFSRERPFHWNRGINVLEDVHYPLIGVDDEYRQLNLRITDIEGLVLKNTNLMRDGRPSEHLSHYVTAYRFSSDEMPALKLLKDLYHLDGVWFDLVVPNPLVLNYSRDADGSVDLSLMMAEMDDVGLFTNGWTGDTVSMLRLASLVAVMRNRPCLVLNTPGTGRSDYGPSEEDWQIAQEMKLFHHEQINLFIHMFRELTGIADKRVHHVGHSYTGAGMFYLPQAILDNDNYTWTALMPAVVGGQGVGRFDLLSKATGLSNWLPAALNKVKNAATWHTMPLLLQNASKYVGLTHYAVIEAATNRGTLNRGPSTVISYLDALQDTIPLDRIFPKDGRFHAFFGEDDKLVMWTKAMLAMGRADFGQEDVTVFPGCGHYAVDQQDEAGIKAEQEVALWVSNLMWKYDGLPVKKHEVQAVSMHDSRQLVTGRLDSEILSSV